MAHGGKVKSLSKLTLLSVLTTSTMFAQQPTKAPQATSKPPTITDAQKVRFFKAQLQAQQAAQAAQEKSEAFKASVKELQDYCGKDATLQLDTIGDPMCAANAMPAVTPKPTEPKK
jgi:hypothetical protein